MSVTVRIPTALRQLTDDATEVPVPAGNVAAIVGSLQETYPGLGERLLDEQGRLRRFVNIFVEDEDMRFLEGLDTAVEEGQVVTILPAVAGG